MRINSTRFFAQLLAILFWSPLLWAQAEEARQFSFALPAQSLVQSLADFSRITGQALIYNPAIAQAKNAPAMQGSFTADQALQRLLDDKGLQAQQKQNAWVIKLLPVEVPREKTSPVIVDEVVVTGYYTKSLQAALAKKYQSNQILDAVVAEDIEKLPAQNIAEALQHSPGVTVVRDRGEALFISIRGLPSSFNKVTLNGNSLASNENVRNSGQYGRRFHFDTFPAELVAGVEVIKTSSADQDEGAIGGSVNIRTFAPFEIAHNKLSLAASVDESQLAGSGKPRLSLLGNWLNSDSTLGVTIAGSYAQRSLRQDRALNFGWQTIVDDKGESLITPLSLRPTLELEGRERQGLTAALQWQPDEQLQLDLHWLVLAQNIDYNEFSYGASYDATRLTSGTARLRGDALFAGETDTGSAQISRESAGIVDRNHALDLDLHYQWNDWQLDVRLADSQARSYNDDPIKRIRLRSDSDLDLQFNFPQINGERIPTLILSGAELENPQEIFGRRLEWRMIDSRDREQSLGVSAKYQWDGDWLESLAIGAKLTRHQRVYLRKDAIITQGIADERFPAEAYEHFPVKGFLAEAEGHFPQQWLIPNEEYFWRNVDESVLSQQSLSWSDLLNSYDIDENSQALFIKTNFHHQLANYEWHGDIGVRGVYSRQEANGYRLDAEGAGPASFINNYFYLLPSLNFVLDFTPQLRWRNSLGKSMARPDFQDIAPRITLNSGGELTAVGGNPRLKPVTSMQWDSALEWYFSGAGLLSAGLFYKQLDDFFQNQISPLQLNGKTYALSSIGNGAEAYARGLELAYQQKLPAPLQHIGIESNYTYTDSRAHYHSQTGSFYDDLADVAKNSLNIGGYFETENFTLRLHYSWRDQVLNQVGMANTSALNAAAFGSLDMHAAYVLAAGCTLSVDAINLANSAQQEFVADNEFASYTLYGRRFLVGIKWDL